MAFPADAATRQDPATSRADTEYNPYEHAGPQIGLDNSGLAPWTRIARKRAQTWPGTGLLGEHWGHGRTQHIIQLAAAYANIADGRAQNFGLFLQISQNLRSVFERKFAQRGLELPDMALDVLMERLAPATPHERPHEHLALVSAMLNDYSTLFTRHLEYRLATDANNHLEITGGTGSGKSSCALTIANWLEPIAPQDVEAHVNFDLGELPHRLKNKKARQTVIQDEFIQMTGEGANTVKALFTNLEDTLRGSQVNLFVLSPRRQEHGTMQATLEAVLWNRQEKFTVFLVWIADQPRGVVAVPWCDENLWRGYSTWKAKNVERSMSGAFQDSAWAVRNAMKFFDDPKMNHYLRVMVRNRQFTKTDFERAISNFRPDAMSVSQRANIASLMFEMVTCYKRAARYFEDWFDAPPNEGLRLLAGKAEKMDDEEEASE